MKKKTVYYIRFLWKSERNPSKIDAGYVICHKEYFDDMELIRKWCEKNSVKLAGRYGKWAYSVMEDAILDGIEAVK